MDTSSVRASLYPSRSSRVALAVASMLGASTFSQAQGPIVESPDPTVAPITVAQFDEQIMRERGLDPAIGNYFRRVQRFAPGTSVVNVTLNGVSLGRKEALFDGVGQLCFTAAFVRAIGLRKMADGGGQPVPEGVTGTCLQYSEFAPQTVVTLQPSSGAVDIVTSPEFVESSRMVATEQGGMGGLLNYRAFAMESQFDGTAGTGFRQVDSTLGFNADDWIFRSQQTYTQTLGAFGSKSRLRLQSVYGQKTFAEHRQVFQGGRTWTQSPLYGGIAFSGAQWFPERALRDSNSFAVTGLANSRARVEVRQNGALLYSTVVPPGPFSINDFALPNLSTDLQVKVIEESGAEQAFTVPASALLLSATASAEEGLSVSAGQLRDTGDVITLKADVFLTGAQGWRLGPRTTGVAGGLISRDYLSAGAGLNTRLGSGNTAIFLQGLAARDAEHDLQGALGSVALSFSPSDFLQYGLSGNVRSRGYRSVQEAKGFYPQLGTLAGYKTQLSANVRMNAGRLGGISAAITRQDYFSGDPAYIYSLGWNFSVNTAQVAIGVAHNAARSLGSVADSPGGNAGTASSNYVYANLTVPLGSEATSTSFLRRSAEPGRDVTRIGTGVDQRINEYFGYRAAVEKTAGSEGSADTSLSAHLLPKYTSLSVGGSQGARHRSYYGEASGGIVFHGDGVAFTPSPVQDTFGLVKVGDVSGVRLDTPQGPVWSGLNGLAAVPSLLPYHPSRIDVAGRSLPDDVDVTDGLQVVQAGRGAVLKMDMGAKRIRRVLLAVTINDGEPLPNGRAVLRNSTEFFASSTSGGRVMLTDLQEGVTYSAQLAEGKLCALRDIQVGARIEGEQFERGTARCQ